MTYRDPISAEDAHRLRDAVVGVEGIIGLSSGFFGEVALLFAGDRVPGLRIHTQDGTERLSIHLIADATSAVPLTERADAVRTIAGTFVDFPVDVVFDDFTSPADSTPEH
ncbi:hypothetical protein [Corynebacterium renale]|uniref:Uncharacterized protein n=1 Tax=Corynebacterium renale TaxID=1724 RepID=A0A2A9DKW1_9CORY|nr:hypothetical protein [Corynebacterium renale]PFG27243.1 hypothetical protein ATK06_0294 [Corynebacterium renale]SQI23672.1 Uncharacterised protein [Corynebacterium renale]